MRFTKTVSLPLLLLLLLHCLSLAAAARAGSSTVYLLGEGGLTQAALVGLVNRREGRAAVAAQLLPTDSLWHSSLAHDRPDLAYVNTTLGQLASYAVKTGAVESAVVYCPKEPWSWNTVVTLCGLHNAVPVPGPALVNGSLPAPFSKLRVAKDTRHLWKDELQASEWALEHLHARCNRTLEAVATQNPELYEKGLLADYVIQHRLFSFWLPQMCDANSTSQALFHRVTRPAHAAGRLLSILGYFPSQEVVASCTPTHTEITLVSDWCSSLSFWSQVPALQRTVQQVPPEEVLYDPSKTYVAVIASDGDNMQMAFNADRVLMDSRVTLCQVAPEQCPPLSWTISNRLAEFAPYLLDWYFRQAATTGRDSFLLGPSGYGFLHPSAMRAAEPVVDTFVGLTLEAATLLHTSAFVQWDEYNNAGAPESAEARQSRVAAAAADPMSAVHRAPRRAGNEAAMAAYIQRFEGTGMGVFTPVLPSLAGWVGDVPVFQEILRWFGADDPLDVAEVLNNPDLRGQLGFLYKILDVPTHALSDLVAGLDDHVQLVGYRELMDLARQKRVLHEDVLPAEGAEEEALWWDRAAEYGVRQEPQTDVHVHVEQLGADSVSLDAADDAQPSLQQEQPAAASVVALIAGQSLQH